MKHPTMLDIGTLSCYFNIEQLKEIELALVDRFCEYSLLNQERTMNKEEFYDLQERVGSYIKQYERRMKDGI